MLEIESAEDDLVQKTEVAITLMKTSLENVCRLFLYILLLLILFASLSLSRTLTS